MEEQFTRVGDLELCYETFGDPADPALLLIMGLGTQMVAWPVAFCERLAARGLHVIRFDNRDIGRSTHLKGAPTPSLLQLATRDRRGAAYRLEDMAADAVGLLDALGIEAAHVVGASMGGMIAQLVAIGHPGRTRSLTSIMSTTGNRFKGQPAMRVYPMLLKSPPRDRHAAIERTVALFRLVGSTGFETMEGEVREIAAVSWERGNGDRRGTARQMAAIVTAADRTRELRRLDLPALVIHGTRDKLVRPSGGRATAQAIPGARLELVDGMGHDLPRWGLERIAEAIADTAERAA